MNKERLDSDPEHIACWQRIDARTTTSGRLAAQDVAALAALGVRHVINLALADSPGALSDEDALLAGQDIAYTHIPLPFGAPDDTHFAAFRRAYEGGDGPVHVHCIANWRVSAFLYRWHRDHGGMAEGEARALMERQWSPETTDHADAPAWSAFIAARGETA